MGTAVQCGHTDDAQTRAVMARIREEHGRLDVLVNNVWGGYEGLHLWDERGEKWDAPLWEQPTSIWDDLFAAGVRAHSVTSQLAAMAKHLRPHSVTSVSLYPGLVRTEGILLAPEGAIDLSNSESPQFIGRAVAALASDLKVFGKTGQVLVAAELGAEYGFTDIGGRRPGSLRREWEE